MAAKEETRQDSNTNQRRIKSISIDKVQLLNPKLSGKKRQRNMALWLMPFGLVAGLTFSKMTGLNTFSEIGLGSIGEPLIAGFLGMSSGLIGSYVASASVNPEKDDYVWSLRKRSQEGEWLVIIETPFEVELPWSIVQEVSPVEIVRLRDL